MDNGILQPLDAYQSDLKERHRQLTEEYFDSLVEQSGVSQEENAELIKERNKALAKLNDADKNISKKKTLRGFIIFCIVLLFLAAFITAIVFLGNGGNLAFLGVLLPILCVGAAIALIVVICKVINKQIKQGEQIAASFRKQADDLEAQAWRQMAPLNCKFDWNIPDRLIYNATPQIQLDKYFDEDKYGYFAERYPLDISQSDDASVYCARTGNSDGNPFLLTRYALQNMVPHVYTGTRVVTWTETTVDSKGNVHTHTCSQTLVATVTKPKPNYYMSTKLMYGSDSAPDLHFSRTPVVPADADDKKIKSLIKSGERKLEKKTQQAVKNGTTYNKLANSEFEVLFGAENRDNEMQFRLMFTPLAQQNMVKLLTSKKPYGDDFSFEKCGSVNIIHSRHGATLDIDANPARFVNFDLAAARKNFIDYNVEYFKSLYFDFAPLLSIPIYTQERSDRHFGECTDHGHIREWEIEAVANHFDEKLLAPQDAKTQCILKARHISDDADGKGCNASVTAYSFTTEPRADIVPVLCRNGRLYDVVVPWVQYIPVQQETQLHLQAVELTREQFLQTDGSSDLSTVFVGGIVARLLN